MRTKEEVEKEIAKALYLVDAYENLLREVTKKLDTLMVELVTIELFSK